jgi:hypothetical protein
MLAGTTSKTMFRLGKAVLVGSTSQSGRAPVESGPAPIGTQHRNNIDISHSRKVRRMLEGLHDLLVAGSNPAGRASGRSSVVEQQDVSHQLVAALFESG